MCVYLKKKNRGKGNEIGKVFGKRNIFINPTDCHKNMINSKY